MGLVRTVFAMVAVAALKLPVTYRLLPLTAIALMAVLPLGLVTAQAQVLVVTFHLARYIPPVVSSVLPKVAALLKLPATYTLPAASVAVAETVLPPPISSPSVESYCR
jgi:hypothetical protein